MDKTTLHKEIINNIHAMYKDKNEDYGDSFDKSLDKFGLLSSLIRLTDKMNRFEQLIDGESKVTSESIDDTLLDMANYAIMTVMWRRINESEVREYTPTDDNFYDNIALYKDYGLLTNSGKLTLAFGISPQRTRSSYISTSAFSSGIYFSDLHQNFFCHSLLSSPKVYAFNSLCAASSSMIIEYSCGRPIRKAPNLSW